MYGEKNGQEKEGTGEEEEKERIIEKKERRKAKRTDGGKGENATYTLGAREGLT